jgi:hypothetical protein
MPCLSGLSPNWICGFTDAAFFHMELYHSEKSEGCFDIKITARGSGSYHQVECRFRLTQHIKNKVLLELLLPFFDKNPLHSSKLIDYLDFKQVVELVNSKQHLNSEGLSLIRALKASMNNGLGLRIKIWLVYGFKLGYL